MNTLVDFFAFTKGVQYLMAIVFVLAFSAFWLVVYGKRKGLALKMGVLIYLALGFLLMVGSCLTTGP